MGTVGIWLGLALFQARAEDVDESSADDAPPSPPVATTWGSVPVTPHVDAPVPPPPVVVAPEPLVDPNAEPPVDFATAEGVPALTRGQMSFLEPRHSRFGSLHRAQTDFTAYTLEWGEVKIGLAGVSVGALPRFQLTTVPLLDAAQVYNGSAKLNFLTAGPVDLALQGGLYRLPVEDFYAQFAYAGLWSSVRVTDPWSIHLGGYYDRATAQGLPDVSNIAGILSPSSREGLEAWTAKAREEGVEVDAAGDAIIARMASDVRLNRRDSIVFQAQTLVWSKVASGINTAEAIPPIFGLDTLLSIHQEGFHSLGDYYITSVAWQFSWSRVDLRVGVGLSSIPMAWLLQSTELSVRLGGKTRREESRIRDGWERNKHTTDAPKDVPAK